MFILRSYKFNHSSTSSKNPDKYDFIQANIAILLLKNLADFSLFWGKRVNFVYVGK